MLWVGTAAVLRVQSCASESSAGPAASGEKGTEDVLPSWRSLRSLGVQGTALVLGSGSLAANGEISATILFPRNVGVKENRKTFCAKGPAHNLITRLPEKWNWTRNHMCGSSAINSRSPEPLFNFSVAYFVS